MVPPCPATSIPTQRISLRTGGYRWSRTAPNWLGEQYGQPTYAVADGQVTATYPIVAVALEPVTVDPLALLAAEQAAIIESLLAALDTANVIDAAQVKADSKAGQADNDLLIRSAKAFGMSVDEVVKVRDTDPKRWAELTAKFDGEGK